jgi:protoheme IX farnesyltransferase
MKAFLKLSRFYMSLAIAFSALAGFVFYNHGLGIKAFYLFFGVFLLSAGASALNQYQERYLDALMKRTQTRPLPLKQMRPITALAISFIFALSGTMLLYFSTGLIAAALGIFNIFWYNAIYTPAKRVTSLAVFIGALTGAIPPMMGWVAAGGYLLNTNILIIAFFMFLWQIPHFYLLLLRFGEEYKIAGFPSILSSISEKQVKTVIFVWILGTIGCTLFFPLFHLISGIFLTCCLLIINALLIFYFSKIVFNKTLLFNFSPAFRSLYIYQVLILTMLVIEALK